MTVYADKGEWITCEAEHPIVQLAETVYWGHPQELDRQLENWQVPAPDKGAPFSAIFCHCGAQYTRLGRSAGIFHFEDGWRGDE